MKYQMRPGLLKKACIHFEMIMSVIFNIRGMVAREIDT